MASCKAHLDIYWKILHIMWYIITSIAIIIMFMTKKAHSHLGDHISRGKQQLFQVLTSEITAP